MYKVGFMVGHQSYVPHAEVLVESIRSFGGYLKDAPIAIMTPKHQNVIMNIQGITQVDFVVPRKYQRVPYVDKMIAAMHFEQLADGPILWMDVDSIVLQEPLALKIDQGISVKVVDKRNIGLKVDEPLDGVWKSIYEYYGLEDKFQGITTTIDCISIKPYFNAGLVAVNSDKGIFAKTVEGIEVLLKNGLVKKSIQSSKELNIFFHQAVLTGAILASYDWDEIILMGDMVNYPLHFKNKYPRELGFDSIQTLRYDTYFDKSKGLGAIKHIIREKEQYLGTNWYY